MNFIIIVLFLALFFIACYKKNKWASILVLLHLASIVAGLLLDYQMRDSVEGFFAIVLICTDLYLIISPWTKFKRLDVVFNDYGKNLKLYSNIVLFIGIFATLFFIPVVIVLYNSGFDTSEFKYGEGMDEFFRSPAFPIPFKIFILITFFANISIIALPLHFYYLTQREGLKSVTMLIASFAYVMRGLTYFSRAIPLQYIMLYGMLFLIFRKQIPQKILKKLKFVVGFVVVLLLVNMIGISNDRFEDHYSFNQTEYVINKEKYIDNPLMVSYIDYLSQGYYNCYDLLIRYDGRTFHGQTMFNELLVLMNQYLSFPFSSDEYQSLREKLWPGLWNKSFNSYVAYMVFDFGIIGSLFFMLLYYLTVSSFFKHSRSVIGISQLTWITFLIQVPLFSIFYNALAAMVIPMLFYTGLNFLLRPRQKSADRVKAHTI